MNQNSAGARQRDRVGLLSRRRRVLLRSGAAAAAMLALGGIKVFGREEAVEAAGLIAQTKDATRPRGNGLRNDVRDVESQGESSYSVRASRSTQWISSRKRKSR
jgi:hypothetical protein